MILKEAAEGDGARGRVGGVEKEAGEVRQKMKN